MKLFLFAKALLFSFFFKNENAIIPSIFYLGRCHNRLITFSGKLIFIYMFTQSIWNNLTSDCQCQITSTALAFICLFLRLAPIWWKLNQGRSTLECFNIFSLAKDFEWNEIPWKFELNGSSFSGISLFIRKNNVKMENLV